MKTKNIPFYITVLGSLLLSSCDTEVPFETTMKTSFVYIADANGLGKSEVWDLAQGLTTDYYIKLSSGTRRQDLMVYFDIIPGNGLQEGVDYSVTSPASDHVVFTPGLYDNVIRIRWLPNPIDPSKDNTLTISLTEISDKNVIAGFPGPARNNAKYVVTKIQQ